MWAPAHGKIVGHRKMPATFTNSCLPPNDAPIIRADDNPFTDRRFRQSIELPDGARRARSRPRSGGTRARRQTIARTPAQADQPRGRARLRKAAAQRAQAALSGSRVQEPGGAGVRHGLRQAQRHPEGADQEVPRSTPREEAEEGRLGPSARALGVASCPPRRARRRRARSPVRRDRRASFARMLLRRMLPLTVVGAVVASSAPVTSKPPPTAAEVDQRASAILAKMTLEEKIDYLGGVDNFYVRAVPRLGLPAFRMADGPFGVRNVGPATTYPAGIGLAASWDVGLAERVGAMIGRDARARGVAIMLAPGVNIYRAPMCGRNFEYLGEDPYLPSRMAVAYIEGMQAQGVSATIKHFLGNNSEVDRHHTSSDIDARALRELYLPAFEAAVKEAHVGALMTSYNLVDGVHMTENAPLVEGLLKKEWGFDGIVMSDWDATYDGVAAANAGLDVEMPAGTFMNRETLLPAVKAGKVSVAT